MLDQIKTVLETRESNGAVAVYSTRRDTSYIYVVDSNNKIYFTSTGDSLRYNTLVNDLGLRDLIKESAEKLGRKFIEAEFPDDFLANKQLRNTIGNWDPKALGFGTAAKSATATTTTTVIFRCD